MKKVIITRIVSFVVFVLILFNSYSCRLFRHKSQAEKQMEKIEDKKEEKQEMKIDAYEDAIKRHMKIQKKDTRKRMKRTYNKSQRVNNNKPSFWGRIKIFKIYKTRGGR